MRKGSGKNSEKASFIWTFPNTAHVTFRGACVQFTIPHWVRLGSEVVASTEPIVLLSLPLNNFPFQPMQIVNALVLLSGILAGD